jgi:hypothetical protein
VKESFTAAIVARSLLAAERSSWLVGVLEGWVVARRELVWPVSWEVVVAVDIGTWNLLGESVESPDRHDCWQTGAGSGWKNPLTGGRFWRAE